MTKYRLLKDLPWAKAGTILDKIMTDKPIRVCLTPIKNPNPIYETADYLIAQGWFEEIKEPSDMRYFSRSTCKMLQEMGCNSKSGFYYSNRHDNVPDIYFIHQDSSTGEHAHAYNEGGLQVFIQQDFIGCEQYAKENSKIVWGDSPYCSICKIPLRHERMAGGGIVCLLCCQEPALRRIYKIVPRSHIYRHMMIDAEDAERFLLETMVKK